MLCVAKKLGQPFSITLFPDAESKLRRVCSDRKASMRGLLSQLGQVTHFMVDPPAASDRYGFSSPLVIVLVTHTQRLAGSGYPHGRSAAAGAPTSRWLCVGLVDSARTGHAKASQCVQGAGVRRRVGLAAYIFICRFHFPPFPYSRSYAATITSICLITLRPSARHNRSNRRCVSRRMRTDVSPSRSGLVLQIVIGYYLQIPHIAPRAADAIGVSVRHGSSPAAAAHTCGSFGTE